MRRYLISGLITGTISVIFLILDVTTYLDYMQILSIGKSYMNLNPAPFLIQWYGIISLVLGSFTITFLIIHFKKWDYKNGESSTRTCGNQTN